MSWKKVKSISSQRPLEIVKEKKITSGVNIIDFISLGENMMNEKIREQSRKWGKEEKIQQGEEIKTNLVLSRKHEIIFLGEEVLLCKEARGGVGKT